MLDPYDELDPMSPPHSGGVLLDQMYSEQMQLIEAERAWGRTCERYSETPAEQAWGPTKY